jgi:hypothetical protein
MMTSKRILTLCLALWAVMAAATAAMAGGKAVVFVDKTMTGWEEFSDSFRFQAEEQELKQRGYDVEVRYATDKEIRSALEDKEVKVVSFFGHNTSYKDLPTLGNFDIDGLLEPMRRDLLKKYRAEGLSMNEANEKANAEVGAFSFGKQEVRNFSCFSMSDTKLADALVAPGGVYKGTPKMLTACPLNLIAYYEVADFTLSTYKVPYARGEDYKALAQEVQDRMQTLDRARLEALMANAGVKVPADFYACLCRRTTVEGVGSGHRYVDGKCIWTGVLGGTSEVQITGRGNEADWGYCLGQVTVPTAAYPDGAQMQDIVSARIRVLRGEEVGIAPPAPPPPPAPSNTIVPAIPPIVTPKR